MKILIFLIIVYFIVSTSFKIEPIKSESESNGFLTIDFRDAIIGTYFCNMSCSKLDGQKPGINNSSDTICIIVIKDVMDSILQINLGEEIVKVKLRSQTLESFPRNGHYGGYLFAADSINFYYGPSRSSSSRYIGKKK